MSAPNDLVTLAAAKQWLGVATTGDDGLISGLVTAVSRAILADLGRTSLLPAGVVDTFDGHRQTALVLRQWPVSQIASVTIDDQPVVAAASASQVGWVLDRPDVAPPGAPQRLSYRYGDFGCGRQNVVVTYRAGYEISGEAAIVPPVAPYTVTAAAPFGAWTMDTGVTGASGTYAASAGIYTFQAVAAGQAVTLSYAYVPSDLAQAACEWVADRYAARTRIGQSAKTLGGQETTSFIVKAMPDTVNRLLQPYRRIAR